MRVRVIEWVIGGLLALSCQVVQAAPAPAIPGARSCFWFNGPFSGDPYINAAYPDEYAFYWTAAFTVPAGASLHLEGQFAHARYQSFVTYNALGQAVESVADYRIDPLPGSVNPFRPGVDRRAARRSYRFGVTGKAQGLDTGDGRADAAPRSSINAPPTQDGYQSLIYRIYANDRGPSITGAVPLPEAVVTLADGRELRGDAACDALTSRRPMLGRVEVLNTPAAQYHELRKGMAERPAGWPAKPQPEWHVQHTRPDTLSIFTGDHAGRTARKGGDFYPNPDNRYLRSFVSTKLGEVLVLHGKAPVTPRTFAGDGPMGTGQLRYWSLCANQVMVNTRVTDCLYDEQVPLDARGWYTIVASKAKDRPRNARPECGVAWLELPARGDGLGDDDLSLIIFRHMLAAPDFPQALQNLQDDAEIAPELGEYLPSVTYAMVNAVETLFPCPLDRKTGTK